jgi:hypothetical protein
MTLPGELIIMADQNADFLNNITTRDENLCFL